MKKARRGGKSNKQWFLNEETAEFEELGQIKNEVRGSSYPAWGYAWENAMEGIFRERDDGKIFPSLSLDPIEDLPLSAKQRKEMHELMERMGITKREERTTAELILSTRPTRNITFEEVLFRGQKYMIPFIEMEFMPANPDAIMRIEDDIDKQESIATKIAKTIKVNTKDFI